MLKLTNSVALTLSFIILLLSVPALAQGGTTISQLVIRPTRSLQPGDVLTVTMIGTANGQAQFEILGTSIKQNMRETSRGVYEGQFTVPRGLALNGAAVMGLLSRSGLDATKVASDRVTTTQGGGLSNPPSSVNGGITLQPNLNENVTDRRPSIGVEFNQGQQPNNTSLWFLVDGHDISKQAKFWKNRVNWTPSTDLSLGQHNVDFLILDTSGRKIVDQKWNFTVSAPGGTTPNPPAGGSKLTFMPLNNSTQSGRRPRIGAQFPGTVDQRTRVDARRIRFKLDGINVSKDVSVSRDQIFYLPPTDLAPGRHNVDLLAFDMKGDPIVDQGWSFTIGGSNSGGTTNRLSATNIQDGMLLGSQFSVNGTGVPGSQVVVTVEYPKKDILSQLAGIMLRFQGQANVNSNGTFAVPLDASGVRQGEPMTITITDSVQSPTVTYQTKKGQPNLSQPPTNNSGNPTPPATPTKITFTVSPTDGDVSGNTRPRIGSSFSQQVTRSQLIIDGRDFTPQARVSKGSIFWDAPYDLDKSQHSATVTVWVNGTSQSQSWTFSIK
jgi:hypothetical protein